MTFVELIADLLAADRASMTELLFGRLLLRSLADHAHDLQLSNGSYLSDVTSFRDGLRESAEALRIKPQPVSTFGNHKLRASGRVIDSTCPRCGHIHQGEQECGTQMGRDRLCRCDLEVPA